MPPWTSSPSMSEETGLRIVRHQSKKTWCTVFLGSSTSPYLQSMARGWRRHGDDYRPSLGQPMVHHPLSRFPRTIISYDNSDSWAARNRQVAAGTRGRLQDQTKEQELRSIFWIDASHMDSLYQSYESIAQKLDIPGWDSDKADSTQLVKAYLSAKEEKQHLLIFDNADDVSLGSSGMSTRAAHLSNYLPQSEQCAILYTTTNRDMAERLAAPNVIELEAMAPITAQTMLENYPSSKQQRTSTPEASHCRSPSLVAKQMDAVPGRDSELPEDRSQEHDTTGPVATTLLISLDQLRSDSGLATDYLFLTAYVDRKDIPLDLLPAASPREREEVVKVLSSYGLVTRRPAESSVDLHQLVHYALRGWLQKQERLQEWTTNAIRELYRVFPGNNHGGRSKWRRLLPHARYALSHSSSEQEGGDRSELVWKSAKALYNDGRWREAEQLFVQVMETRKRVLGDEHPSTLTSMASLASTYRNQGRWKEAELEVQMMETRKRALGDEHPSMLTSMANLASTYRNQGRWKEAEQLEVQVMETSSRVLGDEHPDTLTSMANLAFTHKGQDLYDKAVSLLEECCRLQRQVLGPKHPHTVLSLKALQAWRAGNIY
ncbi:hypothetical protein BU23DRAFT_597114 [Bimuria novae-zelandiae CBS 107.79]|uniref:TPR-like protein n=1 Tax=Bimuria novae-zelandiae CBS 107.79 TaxID=1447943 RepID=A0A6A5VML7_9PLEO|nr:hypothetical protein BU23DRAFT_597114 [Bimuria novae-zelandiae CBS 107.79]